MALPASVRVINETDGIRIILPVRERTSSRWAGLIPVFFGLPFLCVGLGVMLSSWGLLDTFASHATPRLVAPEGPVNPEMPEAPEKSAPQPAPGRHLGIGDILGGCFGIPFFLVGAFIAGFGILSVFPSHAEVAIDSGNLIATDKMGPVPIRRRKPVAQINRLRIGILLERKADAGSDPTNHCIYAENEEESKQGGTSSFRCASRYPVELLQPVAEFLVEEIRRRGSMTMLHAGGSAAVVEITTTADPDPVAAAGDASAVPEEPVPEQPAGSRITFVPGADTLTFVIPRTGFRGAALVLLCFALFWDGISFPFFAIMLIHFLKEMSIENLGMLAFLSLFVGIGTLILLASVQTAFRKSVLLATRESLVFTQTGPFRKSEFQWVAGEIQAVRSGDSNTAVNGKPLRELQVNSNKQSLRRRTFGGAK